MQLDEKKMRNEDWNEDKDGLDSWNNDLLTLKNDRTGFRQGKSILYEPKTKKRTNMYDKYCKDSRIAPSRA